MTDCRPLTEERAFRSATPSPPQRSLLARDEAFADLAPTTASLLLAVTHPATAAFDEAEAGSALSEAAGNVGSDLSNPTPEWEAVFEQFAKRIE